LTPFGHPIYLPPAFIHWDFFTRASRFTSRYRETFEKNE
jgi:hypothetical protein